MQFSAHNVIKGTVANVKKGETTAIVLLNLGGAIVTASITNMAADDLKLAPGTTAYILINPTGVMIAID